MTVVKLFYALLSQVISYVSYLLILKLLLIYLNARG